MKELLLASRIPSGFDRSWFPELSVIVYERYGDIAPISMAFVGAEEMQTLNARYRGKDKPTDVLSFSYESDPERELSGEVIFCESVMRERADENGRSLHEEFQRLTIHAILHILGFTHDSRSDARLMEALEQEVYQELAVRLAA